MPRRQVDATHTNWNGSLFLSEKAAARSAVCLASPAPVVLILFPFCLVLWTQWTQWTQWTAGDGLMRLDAERVAAFFLSRGFLLTFF